MTKQHCVTSHTAASDSAAPAAQRTTLAHSSSSRISVASSSARDMGSNRQRVAARATRFTASPARGTPGAMNPYSKNLFTDASATEVIVAELRRREERGGVRVEQGSFSRQRRAAPRRAAAAPPPLTCPRPK